MITKLKRSTFMGVLMFAMFSMSIISCDQGTDEIVDVESFTDSSIASLQSRSIGKNHCLEFIFPISIEFVDGSTAEVSDYETLHQTIKAWFEANDVETSRENKPQLIFPIQLVNDEGEIIDAASKEELRELRSECPRTGKCNGKRGKGFSCFDLVFPVTVTIDGVDTAFDDKTSLKAAIRAYKAEAGDDAERPSLVFPITVQYEDESQAVANSKEELKDLKEACRDDE